ncbi:MAG TPA: ATP-binding cassette domain-containing protein [Gemmatimonadales bacterium]|nr:ATP-binding cassette domain-containing protein [Gemmatimonadales bacterium]
MQALRGADFALRAGEVQALLGENGAGKTTLMHVAFGLVRQDAGEVRIGGATHQVTSPRTARRLGIGMVHQHFTAIPALTVAENIALAGGWSGHPRELSERARLLSERLRLPLEPEYRAGRLSASLKQRLEIVKALAADARILLLDEPTAVLAPAEAEELVGVIRSFAESGGSAVLITHKLDEALRAADRVTVLRQGSVTYTGTPASQTAESLARAMIGPGPALPVLSSPTTPHQVSRLRSQVLVRLDSLEISRESGYGIAVRHAAMTIQAGEIVGVAAVDGNGQRELLRAVAGRLMPLRGRLEVTGPIGFIPEDRTSEGLIPDLSLTENLSLGMDETTPWVKRGHISWRSARARTTELLREYEIVAAGPDAKAASLSGGNQQKLIVARELARNPSVIVAENPTRGLDVSATAAIHERLREAVSAGAALLVHSSDLDEVLHLAHRVIILSRGTLTEVPAGTSRSVIGNMMLHAGHSV